MSEGERLSGDMCVCVCAFESMCVICEEMIGT